MSNEKPTVGTDDMAKETQVSGPPSAGSDNNDAGNDATAAQPPLAAVDDTGNIILPSGWKYKSFQAGKQKLWYASPLVQLLVVSFVCFLCPGMFNALQGLGGGGQVDGQAQTEANTALNSTFSVVGFFAGSFANRIGLRLTLSFGGIGYCLYAASFLAYSHTQNQGFVVFSGAFLGVCAGLLWCAQGAIMMSYPSEDNKGRYISWFWMIFNMGAVIGALIPLAENIHTTTSDTVSDGTYAALIALMLLGAILGLFIVDAGSVIREDGSRVIMKKNPSWSSELWGLWETIRSQVWIISLFPLFFSSNIFYVYQNNGMNLTHFNVRTRALNNLLYWLAQIFGALIFGYGLDFKRISRSVRAKASFCILMALTFIIWGGGYEWQRKQLSREAADGEDGVDWTHGGEQFIGPMFLYFFYGFYDAAWQTSIYWYMGALSNSSRTAANLAGFYKGIQSAGAAVFWGLDSHGISYDIIFGVTWGILALALIIAAPVIFFRIKDTTNIEDDLQGTGETAEEVAAPGQLVDSKREGNA